MNGISLPTLWHGVLLNMAMSYNSGLGGISITFTFVNLFGANLGFGI